MDIEKLRKAAKKWREENGRSQVWVAQEIGLSPASIATYNGWENGKRPLSFEYAQKLEQLIQGARTKEAPSISASDPLHLIAKSLREVADIVDCPDFSPEYRINKIGALGKSLVEGGPELSSAVARYVARNGS